MKNNISVKLKNIKKIILFILVFNINNNLLIGNQNSNFIGLDYACFLPLYTLSISYNIPINNFFYYGIRLNHFWTLGKSINLEIFSKIFILKNDLLELPISLGFLAGWAKEGSFGRTPKDFLGIGINLNFTPITIKTGNLAVNFLTSGITIITDFSWYNKDRRQLADNSGLAISIYLLGTGINYYF